MIPQLPRFAAVSRRAFLRRTALVGGVLIAGVPSLACGNDDDSALAEPDTADRGTPSSTTVAGPASSTAGTAVADVTTTVTPPASTPATAATPVPAAASLRVSFTYAAEGSGRRVRNPYIAVWVETPAGDLVQTISLWYAAREAKYLRELTGWYDVQSSYLDAGGSDNVEQISGATRAAGSYQVEWDCTDVEGAAVAQGEYVLFIESAREHGPHQVLSAPLNLGTEGATVAFADDGELSAASGIYTV